MGQGSDNCVDMKFKLNPMTFNCDLDPVWLSYWFRT